MSESIVEMARRMCGQTLNCSECPAHKANNGDACIIMSIASYTTADKQIAALQDWAAANPPRSYKDVLLEQMPKAQIDKYGFPKACKKHLYGGDCVRNENMSPRCDDCWNEPYKEG